MIFSTIVGFILGIVYNNTKQNKKEPIYVSEEKEEFDISSEFDIENINVIAVERLPNGVTNIGYYTKDIKKVEEWNMLTTDEIHKSYVERLKNKIKNK